MPATQATKKTPAKKTPAVKAAPEAVAAPVPPPAPSEPEPTKAQLAGRKAAATRAKRALVPVHLRMVLQVAALNTRLRGLGKTIESWERPELDESLSDSIADLNALEGHLRSLPEGWTPPGKAPRLTLAVGSIVSLTEKGREKYADVLEPEELGMRLSVVKIAGGKVAARMPDGTRVVLARGLVGVVSSADPEAGE